MLQVFGWMVLGSVWRIWQFLGTTCTPFSYTFKAPSRLCTYSSYTFVAISNPHSDRWENFVNNVCSRFVILIREPKVLRLMLSSSCGCSFTSRRLFNDSKYSRSALSRAQCILPEILGIGPGIGPLFVVKWGAPCSGRAVQSLSR